MTSGSIPILNVSSLSHSFGNLKVVKEISFSIQTGKIFSFLGPNGAGKSTVINVLTTLLPIQEGEVTVAGHDLRTRRQKVRESIGIVFQEITLDRDMTVRETLEFHGDLYQLKKEERDKRIEELLNLVELADKSSILTKELSGGMKRRLEIARGLITRPKLLFLDEPTIGLDPQTRRKSWDYLRSVNNDGTTIFLTTHYMDEADSLSDQIAIIDNGIIIAQGTPSELKNSLGEDVIYLETSDNKTSEAILRRIPDIRNVQCGECRIVLLYAADGTHLLPIIFRILAEENISVISVNLKKPSMDDVFMRYTGKELRE